MRRFKHDRRALGAGGAVILLVILVVIGFVGATVGMPYVGKQTISAGDTLNYEFTSSAGADINGKLFIVVMDVGTSTLNYSYIYTDDDGGMTGDETVGFSYDGNVLTVDMTFLFFFPAFISPDDLTDFEATYWVSLSGLTPMLVQKYSTTVGSMTMTVMIKMGTNLVVAAELTDGTDFAKMTLTDTSMMWAKVL